MKIIKQTLNDILFVHTEKDRLVRSYPAFHSHNAYEIYILTRGNRTMYIGDKIYSLTAGDASLMKPNVPHRSSGNEIFDGICIEFSQECIKNNSLQSAQKKIFDCFEQPVISMTSEMTKILYDKACAAEQDKFAKEELLLLTTEFLSSSMRTTVIDINRTLNSDISPIGIYIQKNYLSIEHLDELAAHFKLTKNHLCYRFKKQTGMTVFQYINHLKIQHALGLLQETNIPIYEIGAICGFGTTRQFNKKFKEITNQTPRQVRQISNESNIYIRDYEED